MSNRSNMPDVSDRYLAMSDFNPRHLRGKAYGNSGPRRRLTKGSKMGVVHNPAQSKK